MGLGDIGENNLRLVRVMATYAAYALSAVDFNSSLRPGRSAMGPFIPGLIARLVALCTKSGGICQSEPDISTSQV